jgi:hypothetical protein
MSISLDNIRIFLGVTLAALIGWAASATLGVPAAGEPSPVLLHQPSPGLALLTVGATFLVVVAITLPITRAVFAEAPVFCGALAMAVFSYRSGTSFNALTHQPGTSVFTTMLVESAILFVVVGIGLFITCRLGNPSPALPQSARPGPDADPLDDPFRKEPIDQQALSATCAVVVALFAVGFFCYSSLKMQCLLGVAVGCYIGAWCGHRFIALPGGAWYVVAPLGCALVGYLAAIADPSGIDTGELIGRLAPLGRPVPIDYASPGVIAPQRAGEPRNSSPGRSTPSPRPPSTHNPQSPPEPPTRFRLSPESD